MAGSVTFDQWYQQVRRDEGTMDQRKSLINPRNLIICLTACTVAALWGVLLAAAYFYFCGLPAGLLEPGDGGGAGAAEESLPERLPWYLGGDLPPPAAAPDSQPPLLWPAELPDRPLDRIRNQLTFRPKESEETKIVYFSSGWSPVEVEEHKTSRCPVNSCVFTDSPRSLANAHAVVFRQPTRLLRDWPLEDRPRSQVWVFNSVTPPAEGSFAHPRDAFNWTATPRLDSDVPMLPHGIWMYFSPSRKHRRTPPSAVGGKTLAAAAWLPTRCETAGRAHRLARALAAAGGAVDVFGECGAPCPQGRPALCHKLLRERYRVALVLEHRMCNHSVPDMFYTALEAYTIPVVMAPSKEVYEQLVPEGSFIHVDDFPSTRDLAWHLDRIYADDALFNSYHSWRGTGMFVKSWYCRLCILLHLGHLPEVIIPDVNQWWNPDGECYS